MYLAPRVARTAKNALRPVRNALIGKRPDAP
jgi:hypothetical protein